MAKVKPKYQLVNRKELNERIDELIKVRDEIRTVFKTPLKKMNNAKKIFMLQELDEYETFIVMRIAQLKAIFKPSEN